MEAVRQTQKKYCTKAITAAIFAGFFFILIGQKPVGKGLILGTLFSIFNFVLMGETLPLKMAKSKGKAFVLSLGSIIFRYLIIAIPLIIAIKFEEYNLFSVMAGIFMVQFFILVEHVLSLISSTRGR